MRNKTILLTNTAEPIEDEIDRLFDQLVVEGIERMAGQGHRTWSPPMDVFETDSYFLVRLEVAGMHEDDFRVIFQDQVLYIQGERREPEGPRRLYHQMQIRYGTFLTAVRFDTPIKVEEIDAEYEAGFLTVRLPRKETARTAVEVEEGLVSNE